MKKASTMVWMLVLTLVAVFPAAGLDLGSTPKAEVCGAAEMELPLFEFNLDTFWGCPFYTISCWADSQCSAYCGGPEFAVCERFCCACYG